MAPEKWPNPKARYVDDDDDGAAHQRWQTAIDAAIDSGSIRLDVPSNGVRWSRDLRGACPRCGHALRMRRIVYKEHVGVAAPDDGPPADLRIGDRDSDEFVASFQLRCSCREEHTDQPPDAKGCGAGTGIWVDLVWRWGRDGI